MRFSAIVTAAVLIAAEGQAQDAAPPPPVAASGDSRGISGWPAPGVPAVLREPDFSYPGDALRRDQEGEVVFALLIGRDGAPRECRIVSSSGHKALDEGSCQLGPLHRFAPLKDAGGEPVETSVVRAIHWTLPTRKRRPFAETTMAVRLALDAGNSGGCEVAGSGPLTADWQKLACRTARHYAAPFRGAASASNWRTVEMRVRMSPAGGSRDERTPSARAVAFQIADLELDRTYVRSCRLREAETRGNPSLDGEGICFLFACGMMRFERPAEDGTVRRALLTVELVPGAD